MTRLPIVLLTLLPLAMAACGARRGPVDAAPGTGLTAEAERAALIEAEVVDCVDETAVDRPDSVDLDKEEPPRPAVRDCPTQRRQDPPAVQGPEADLPGPIVPH
jgi:hypothetical protein